MPYSLTSRGRKPLTQDTFRSGPLIPANVLYRICLAVEDSQDDILDQKHQTNLNILAMMDVSQSWRVSIASFTDLFRHIALNTSDGRTIVTAGRILQMAETRSTRLEVFIKGAFRDLIGNAKLQVMAKELLRRLRLQSGRFVSFETRSQTSHLGSYFNLPRRSCVSCAATTPCRRPSSPPRFRASAPCTCM